MQFLATGIGYKKFWNVMVNETGELFHELGLYLQRMSDGEKVVWICLFTLVVMFLMVRRPKGYKEGGGMGRQFVFALVIVVVFSFGATWVFDGTAPLNQIN